MTSQQQEARIPELTLGWRLKMALGEMSRAEMADHLGVDPGTISRWMGDKGKAPRRVYLSQWALATGVSLDWLESGIQPEPGGGGPDGGRSTEQPAAVARLAASKRRGTRGGTTAGYLVPATAA